MNTSIDFANLSNIIIDPCIINGEISYKCIVNSICEADHTFILKSAIMMIAIYVLFSELGIRLLKILPFDMLKHFYLFYSMNYIFDIRSENKLIFATDPLEIQLLSNMGEIRGKEYILTKLKYIITSWLLAVNVAIFGIYVYMYW